MSDGVARTVSRLGFGVSGAHGTPLVSRRQTLALIESAFAQGVTVFDTAPAYGNGEAERRLGLALKRLGRDSVQVMTKVGLFSHGLAGRRRDFSLTAVEASLSSSLARLDVEGVDYLFLHGPDPSELTPALFSRLDALRGAGAFKTLGVAGRAGELDAALETGRFQAIMAPVHPYLDEVELSRLRAMSDGGVMVFAIETAGDGRPALRAPRRPADLYRLARALRAAPGGRGRTDSVTGLRNALSQAWVSCALTTTTRSDHLAEAAALLNSR